MSKYKQFKIIDSEIWVNYDFLIKKGVPKGTINNGISLNKRKGKNSWLSIKSNRTDGYYYIKLLSIPPQTLKRYDIPYTEKVLAKYGIDLLNPDKNIKNEKLTFLSSVLSAVAKNKWSYYVAYYSETYYPNHDLINSLAVTHAVFYELISLSESGEYTIQELYEAYTGISLDIKLYYRASSYTTFSKKLTKCKIDSIENSIPHKAINKVSNNLKLDDYWKKRLLALYISPKKLTKTLVQEEVNKERLANGLDKINYNTVQNYLNTPEVKNIVLKKRHGMRKYRDEIYPYFQLSSKSANEIWQIDGARIPFVYEDKEGKTFYDVVIVSDFYSAKILGFSVGKSENSEMIKHAIKNAIRNTTILPNEIIHDNYAPYHSKSIELIKEKMHYFGVNWVKTNNDSPREKGSIERIIGTLNTRHYRKFYGYIGEGVQAKREFSLPKSEKIIEYRKSSNTYNKPELVNIISICINNYNKESIKGKPSPSSRYDQSISSDSKKSFIILKDYHIPFIFFESSKYKINKSILSLNRGGETINYTLPAEFRNTLNGTTVKAYYDNNNLNEIFLFSSKKECHFYLKVSKDLIVPRYKKNRDKMINNYVNKRKSENIKYSKLTNKIIKNAEETSEFNNSMLSNSKEVLINGVDDKLLIKNSLVKSMLYEKTSFINEENSLVVNKNLEDIL